MVIRIYVTGGTFDKEYNELNGELFFKDTHIREMLKLGRCNLSLEIRTLMMIDSEEMTAVDREMIHKSCAECDTDRIVISHGTDTMAETTRFLGQSVEGKTIVLSTHQMNRVEALCDRILLIDRGCAVLYGPLAEIKRAYAPNAIRVHAPHIPPDMPGVVEVAPDDGAFNLALAETTAPQEVLRALLDRGVEVEAFEVAPVPLEDIFVAAVSGGEG